MRKVIILEVAGDVDLSCINPKDAVTITKVEPLITVDATVVLIDGRIADPEVVPHSLLNHTEITGG